MTSHEDMQSSEHNPGQPPDVCTGAELHQHTDNESTPKDVVFVSSTEQNSLQVIADGVYIVCVCFSLFRCVCVVEIESYTDNVFSSHHFWC